MTEETFKPMSAKARAKQRIEQRRNERQQAEAARWESFMSAVDENRARGTNLPSQYMSVRDPGYLSYTVLYQKPGESNWNVMAHTQAAFMDQAGAVQQAWEMAQAYPYYTWIVADRDWIPRRSRPDFFRTTPRKLVIKPIVVKGKSNVEPAFEMA